MPNSKKHSTLIEVTYLACVLAILLALPQVIWRADSMEDNEKRIINIVAKNPPGVGNARWSVYEGKWDFTGKGQSAIRIKEGENVVLRITSTDNVHRFTLPVYGVEEIVYPGKITEVSFTADMIGEYSFSCTIICGDNDHTKMTGVLVIEQP